MSQSEVSAPIVLTVRQFARSPLHVLLRDRVTFGRDCDGFLLADNRASRRHAEFRVVGNRVYVTDLGSSNGTTRNGQPIRGETPLDEGDVVGIGNAEIVVGAAVASATAPTGPARLGELTTDMELAEQHRSSIARLSETVNLNDVSDLAAGIGDEGTVTIVFSDIENSTVRATSLGDESWLRALDVHNRIVREQLRKHGGREIKSQGDGFMLSFDSARRAVMFAIDTQREMTQRRITEPSWDLTIRIGVHTGEAVRTADGDLYGRHVIIASRIADHASGGEILVSSLVRELTSGKIDLHYDLGRTVDLKGIGHQTVHRVAWSEARTG
ncbi:MAG: FHA domain-containing protein [Acidimicrobiia bacterium]|nr:FHA domain-containing protein [Acidimicrobiia bacterium]